jgi:anaerobic selenocysteine-containing dehydrogenase
VRWQERTAATALEPAKTARSIAAEPKGRRLGKDKVVLGTHRDIWSGAVPELNPALRFLAAEQRLELSPADAERLGLEEGDEVTVSQNGTSVTARTLIRERMRPGAAFLVEATSKQSANVLANGRPKVVRVEKAPPG